MSDIAYSFTGSSSYKNVSNGSLSSTSTVGYYSYTTIRRCNLVLENAGQVSFTDEVKRRTCWHRLVLLELGVIFR